MANANLNPCYPMNEATDTVPRAIKEINLSEKDFARFWKKVDKKGADECWTWLAYKDAQGYGHFGAGGQVFSSHRVSYAITNGQIPHNRTHHGICVCHRCDNPSCVNPAHLFLGTMKENMRDRDSKGRGNQPKGARNGAYTKPERMPRGEAHGCSKLTSSQVAEIRALFTTGRITRKEIAVQFGVDRSTINRIINRKIWKHI